MAWYGREEDVKLRSAGFHNEFLTEKAQCILNSIGRRLMSGIKHAPHDFFVDAHSAGQGET